MSRITLFFDPLRAFRPVLILMILIAFTATNAQGMSHHWTATSGDWSLPNNWGGVEPIASDDAYIDNGGTAEITLPGEVCHFLRLGGAGTDKSGTVQMSSGGLAETAAYIGDLGKGMFTQSGGVNTISQILYVGCAAGYEGTYILNGTGQLSADTEYIGNDGNGFFYHSAGTNQVAHDLYLGYAFGSGIYNLSGTGQLSASNEIVGNFGLSIFNQTGGTNTVSNSLTVGFGSTYTLSGNGVLSVGSGGIVVYGGTFEWFHDALTSPSLVVYGGQLVMGFDFSLDALLSGSQFHGTTVQLDPMLSYSFGISNNATGTYEGNSNTTIEILSLGTSAGSGTLNFNGSGTVTVDFGNIGESGIGTVNQTAGKFATFTDQESGIWLGYKTGTQGTYNLSGTGQVTALNEYVGYAGTGIFNHSAGSNTLTNVANLYLGYNSGSSGAYNLSGAGKLSAANEYVGYNGAGTFTQTGGTNTLSSVLEVGCNATGTGTYYLNGTGQLTSVNEYIGYAGIGIFNHSAGTNKVTNTLSLGSSGSSTGNGTYNLSGTGQLTASTEIIGNNGPGTFNQSGGTNTVYALDIRINGIYNLTGGMLITSAIYPDNYSESRGVFNFGGGTLQASKNFSTSQRIKLTGVGEDANFDSGIYTITLSSELDGAGGLNKLGNGTLNLTHSNSYSGNTTVSAGILRAYDPISLPGYNLPGKVTVNNGGVLALIVGDYFDWYPANIDSLLRNAVFNSGSFLRIDTSVNWVYGGTMSGSFGFIKNGSTNLTLSGVNDFVGDTKITAGSLILANPYALQNSTLDYNTYGGTIDFGMLTSVSLGGIKGNQALALKNANSVAIALTVGGNNRSTTYSGNFAGGGSLTKIGTGKLILSGTNTYFGKTTISGGVLQAKSASSLPGYIVSGRVIANSSGTLAVNAGGSGEWSAENIQTVLSLATFNSGSAFGIDTTNATTGNFIYTNPIGGNLSLTKLGTGSLTLSGALTYAGTTTIDQGTLKIFTPVTTQANVVLHDIVGAGTLVVGDGVNDTHLTATSIRVGTLAIGAGNGAMQAVPEPSALALVATALLALGYGSMRSKSR